MKDLNLSSIVINRSDKIGERNRIDALTGMRFLSSMIIVVSHFEFLERYPFGKLYTMFIHSPSLGVDYFFILSGFGLMYSHIHKYGWNIKVYGYRNLIKNAVKRIEGIYPVYIATILLGVPLYVITHLSASKETISTFALNTAVKLIACLTLIQSSFGMAQISHAFNGVCWFLSTIFCIYFVSPLLINFVIKNVTTIKTVALFLAITISVSLLSAAFFKYLEKISFFNELVFCSPYQRVLYVIFGMLLTPVYLYICNKKKSILLTIFIKLEPILPIVFLLYLLLRNSLVVINISVCYVIDFLLCGTIVLTLALNKGKVSRFIAGKNWVYLGNISMYIFLVHYLIRQYVDYVIILLGIECFPIVGGLEIIIIIMITFAISKRLYTLREEVHPKTRVSR